MSHEGGPEQPQRTVAELLAKYGAESGERPRRRRRRADDPSDTGAQQIIERVMSESGEMPVIRDDTPPPERTSHRRGSDYQRQDTPSRRRAQQQPGQASQHMQRPLPPQPSQQLPRPQPAPQPPSPGPGPGQQSSARMSGIAQPGPTAPVRGTPRPQPPQPQPSQQLPRPQPSQRMPMPPGGTRDRSGVQPSLRSRLDGETAPPPPPAPPPMAEATTEEMPRVPGTPSRIPVDGSMTGRRPVPPGADSRTRISPVYPRDPYADPPAEEDDYRSAYPESDPDERYDSAEYENLLDEDDRPRGGRRDFDDLDELDDLEGDDLDEDRERSPAREWLIMIGQLALGVIGGAAVWLGFNWLWGFLPQAALVVALVVIVGLVLIVRKIRRAEDLQTTVLAVLVGLVVTVSPAALLLLNR